MSFGLRLDVVRGLLIGLIMVSGILTPPIPLGHGLPDIRLEDLLLLLFMVGSGLKFPFHDLREKNNRRTTILFITFAVSILVSMIHALLFLRYEFSPRDLTEYIMLGKYWLVFAVASSWRGISLERLRQLAWIALGAAYLVALFGFIQLYNIGNVNEWLTPIYTEPAQMASLTKGMHRTVGTFGNPNVWGFFMMVVLTFQVSWLYHQPLELKSWKFYAQLGLAYVGLMALFMTLSRGAVMVMGILLVYLSLSKLWRDRWKSPAWIVTLAMLVITLIALFTAPQSFLFRMAEGVNFSTSSSVQGRIEQWGSAWELISQSPIFGWGTAKGFLTTIVDNEYILILRRYGLVGLAIFVSLWIHFTHFAFKLVRKAKDPIMATLAESAFVISLGILIFDAQNGIFYNFQVMTLYLLIIGICRSWLTYKEG